MMDEIPWNDQKENKKKDEGKNDEDACGVIYYGGLFYHRILGVDKIFIYI